MVSPHCGATAAERLANDNSGLSDVFVGGVRSTQSDEFDITVSKIEGGARGDHCREREGLQDPALRRADNPLDGLDPYDGRDHCIFEAVIGLAQIFLHGLGIEASRDLVRGRDREMAAGDFEESAPLKFCP